MWAGAAGAPDLPDAAAAADRSEGEGFGWRDSTPRAAAAIAATAAGTARRPLRPGYSRSCLCIPSRPPFHAASRHMESLLRDQTSPEFAAACSRFPGSRCLRLAGPHPIDALIYGRTPRCPDPAAVQRLR
jgi:hypothetical protein